MRAVALCICLCSARRWPAHALTAALNTIRLPGSSGFALKHRHNSLSAHSVPLSLFAQHSTAGTDALQALTRVVSRRSSQAYPCASGPTEDDKPAYYLHRTKDGLGTVEAVLGVTAVRRSCAHTVVVKWLHVPADVAERADRSTTPAHRNSNATRC